MTPPSTSEEVPSTFLAVCAAWAITGAIRLCQAWELAHEIWVYSYVSCCAILVTTASLLLGTRCWGSRLQASHWEVLATCLLCLLSVQIAAVHVRQPEGATEGSCTDVHVGPGQSYIILVAVQVANIRRSMAWLVSLVAVIATFLREVFDQNVDGMSFLADSPCLLCVAIFVLATLRTSDSIHRMRVTNAMVTSASERQMATPLPNPNSGRIVGTASVLGVRDEELDNVLVMPEAIPRKRSMEQRLCEANTTGLRSDASSQTSPITIGSGGVPSGLKPGWPPTEAQSSELCRFCPASKSETAGASHVGSPHDGTMESKRELGEGEGSTIGASAGIDCASGFASQQFSEETERESVGSGLAADADETTPKGCSDVAGRVPCATEANDLQSVGSQQPDSDARESFDSDPSLSSAGHSLARSACAPFAGTWVLLETRCHPETWTVNDWLKTLKIYGTRLRDGRNKEWELTYEDGQVYSANGRFILDGKYLVRMGDTGSQCIYERVMPADKI